MATKIYTRYYPRKSNSEPSKSYLKQQKYAEGLAMIHTDGKAKRNVMGQLHIIRNIASYVLSPILRKSLSYPNNPISWACQHNSTALQIMLGLITLKKRSRISYSLLQTAIKYNNLDSFMVLLQNRNIDVNQQDKYGLTVLMHIINQKRCKFVRALLDRNDVDVSIVDRRGHTCTDHAIKSLDRRIIDLVFKHADVDMANASFSGLLSMVDIVAELKYEVDRLKCRYEV